eukprot:CAMPEP_0181085782 /NCGR_PEP_ID=MMETSP1071-20121207/5406_1 /TAXON_ID=35127 /ORGANISM="Thalassiosira sp., Strain NH16" /LENGTH=961 /DNA_ID=CAMNT_0023167593 /DNA_START=75 /DNA_END=2957 /DNA_ORIENTATION=-
MLRASASRAIRQCSKKKDQQLLSLVNKSTSRRAFFQQPSPSSLNPIKQFHLANNHQVKRRCLGSFDNELLISSSFSRRDNDNGILLSTSNNIKNATESPSFAYNHKRQERKFFSTKAGTKSAGGPSESKATTAVLYDDDADEKNASHKSNSTKTAAKDGSDETIVSSDASSKSTTSEISASASNTTTTAPPNPSSPTNTAIEKKEPSILQKSTATILWAIQSIVTLLLKTPGILWFYLTHPADLRLKFGEAKEWAIHEINHLKMGSKLLAADVRTARGILLRTLRGSTLSRRERKQLLRTATDVFRLVPMSVFVIVPGMEFALPFALKIFPNMLPSTFQDSLKEEEKMKGELQMRISMAGFFQDSLRELAKDQKKVATKNRKRNDENSEDNSSAAAKEESASSFLEFLKKARTGQPIPPDIIINFSKYFEDDLTLDNMGRMQLINMCKYMGIPPYGSNDLLRFYLRHRIRILKDDDQRIIWEGIDSLTKTELREACGERGMRSTGISREAYRAALQEWLDLSVQKKVPVSLLIMSRTFYLHDEMDGGETKSGIVDDGSKGVTGLADAMSGIEKEVLNEIVLEMASSEEKSKNADLMKIQLEVLEQQNDLIEEEQEERDAAAREKKEKMEKAKEQEDAAETAEANGEKLATEEEVILDDKTIFGKDEDVATQVDSLESTTPKDVAKRVAMEEEDVEDEQTTLSTNEIDAIAQLISPDPVQKERVELQKIKDEMKDLTVEDEVAGVDQDEELQKKSAGEASLEISSAISPSGPIQTEEAQEEAVKSIKECEEAIEKEAEEANIVSLDGGPKKDTENNVHEMVASDEEEGVGDVKLQKAIDRLKSRVESMVGSIETQLTDVESKIGDKFHLLDKDRDGVLTMDEMAQVLQTVLKRELSSEEAKAIAADMDANKDGVFSLAELAQWCETNTIVKLAEDGQEKDLDDMIMERVQERRKLKEEDEEW